MYPAQMDNLGWQYSAVDPTLQTQSLHILDHLSNRIFSSLFTASIQDFSAIATVPETANGHAYATLLSLFDQNKKLFSRDRLFIESQDALHSSSPQYQRVMRKANLATFVACVFGRNVPFLELDESFLDLFMPTGTQLLKSEGALFLELKTQAYISIMMMNNSVSREELLDRLFPRDLQLAILRRRPEPTYLAPSEQDFVGRLSARRQYLSAGSDSYEALNQLPQKYNWTDFLDHVCICIRRSLEGMDAINVSESNEQCLFKTLLNPPSQEITQVENTHHAPSVSEDTITKAALAAHAAISGGRSFVDSASPETASSGQKRPSRGSTSPSTSASTPMTAQYEAARASTHPKAPPFTRRPGAPSQRRPWTQEEEKALMDGLDRVKGPYWSQILALYGAGGSIGEVLKDRNQVQLKDKARNLKLFFLKSGIEVPVYLQKVTGELKTRAPAQAAKREMKERMRQMEEERVRLALPGSGSAVGDKTGSKATA
jgi:hypothetical protein